MRKILLVLSVFALFATTASGQTRCSPKISPVECSVVADLMKPLDHQVLPGVSIPVELVTPEEYEKQLADYYEEGKRNDENILYPACKDTQSLKCYEAAREYFAAIPIAGVTHWRVNKARNWTGLSFIRNKPTDPVPGKILISRDACLALGKTIPIPKTSNQVRFGPPEFDADTIFRLERYIAGYIDGVISGHFD